MTDELREAYALIIHAHGHSKSVLEEMQSWTVGGPGTYYPLIELKHFVEDLRSALDFEARVVHDRFCSTASGGRAGSVYMPLKGDEEPRDQFESRFDRAFPQLRSSYPEIANVLLGTLSRDGSSSEMLRLLFELSGTAKHVRLPELKRITIAHPEWENGESPIIMVPHILWSIANDQALVTRFLRESLDSVEALFHELNRACGFAVA